MAEKPRLYFEDGVNYSDKSTCIDYPEIKIRSYDREGGEFFRTVLIYIYVLMIISGSIYLLS